jgi:hypothetical protein
MWRIKVKAAYPIQDAAFTKEGWFLFGFIPLYVRTIQHSYFE